MNSDFKDLLKLFNDFQIRYLVIGGYAVMQYCEPRYTKELDLWVSADPENAARIFSALKHFGAPLSEMSVEDFAHEGFYYQMGIPPARVDILMSVKGVGFEDAWDSREQHDLEGVPANFIAIHDLITTKKASARPQDLIDAQLLELALKSKVKPSE